MTLEQGSSIPNNADDKTRLSFALEAAELGMWDWHIPSDEVVLSRQWAAMLGYDISELKPEISLLEKLVIAEDLPAIKENLNAHLRGDTELYEAQFRMKHKSGDVRWIYDRAKIIERDSEGNPIRMCGIHQDITNLKTLNERLQRTQKMEAVGQLAGGIAHDFNNILAAIMGFADLTTELVNPSSKAHENLEYILKASDRAKSLIQQILSFSRQSHEQIATMPLSPIIKEVSELLTASLPSSIHIHVDVDKETKSICANPTKIHELLMNCATNAAYAMRPKGDLFFRLLPRKVEQPIFSQLGTISPGDYSVIEIEDTGTGISKHVQNKMFEPFFTTKPVGEGTGMGLSVVYGIVKSHNAYIQIESSKGKGALFRFYFPISTSSPVAHSRDGQHSALRGTEKILLVDDEEMIRQLESEMLSSLGYSVTSVAHANEILDRLENDKDEYALLITDQTMPEMSGLELARIVKSKHPHLPIILCSGYSDELARQSEVFSKTTDMVLSKPLYKNEIGRAIRQVLDTSGAAH
ncbi:MAG: PAS domain-containing protein [Chitinivibrionales bacterium]|nr:PAS domain-containing protein [Chitinivibrionales bacterium]